MAFQILQLIFSDLIMHFSGYKYKLNVNIKLCTRNLKSWRF